MHTISLTSEKNILEKLFELRAILEVLKEPSYIYQTFEFQSEILQRKGSPIETRVHYNYKLKETLIADQEDYRTHYVSNILILIDADSLEREICFLKNKFNLTNVDVTKECFKQYLDKNNKS